MTFNLSIVFLASISSAILIIVLLKITPTNKQFLRAYNILPETIPLIITKVPKNIFKKLKYVNTLDLTISLTVLVLGSST